MTTHLANESEDDSLPSVADFVVFTETLEGFSPAEQQKIQRLWEQYFDRLVRLAERNTPMGLRRQFDGEDVALSAMDSFVRGASRGRFPDLRDPTDVWSLLVVITNRKLAYRIRSAKRLKRGDGKTVGESTLRGAHNKGDDSGFAGLESFFKSEPAAEELVELHERCEKLLQKLDAEFRDVVLLKMQGYTQEEISERLGLSVRTIHRRLQVIRKVWSEMEGAEDTLSP